MIKNKLYQKYRKKFPLNEIDFSEDYDKIFDFFFKENAKAYKVGVVSVHDFKKEMEAEKKKFL